MAQEKINDIFSVALNIICKDWGLGHFQTAKREQMKNIQIIILMLLLNSMNCVSQQKKSIVAENYKTENFDVAIFPKTYIDLLPEKRFTPTKAQVDLAELEMKTNLKVINLKRVNQDSNHLIDKNLKKYLRQYFGYIDENGDEILIINSFWKGEKYYKETWLNERVSVNDGGSYFWEVKYNITKGKLFDLYVNGYA